MVENGGNLLKTIKFKAPSLKSGEENKKTFLYTEVLRAAKAVEWSLLWSSVRG